ncbi:hypothetical protein [Psychromonas antarctica]|nr:hypothetical protein [Psychromonas antarctica]
MSWNRLNASTSNQGNLEYWRNGSIRERRNTADCQLSHYSPRKA